MRDVVIVPTYDRPEYAHVCLEYLSHARGVENKEIWLCQDSHYSPNGGLTFSPFHMPEDARKLALFFGQTFGNRALWRCIAPHDTYGNSRNLINSLRHAYDSGAERIFLAEDDIMVAPDIFEWHEEILDKINPFVSCATSLNRSAHFQINGPEAMDESIKDSNAYKRVHRAYSSHASAFTRSNLGDLLAKILEALQWGEWRSGMEQDIVIQNIMGLATFPNAGSAWPYVPRAFNVGMYSYHINTGMKFNGTLEEKCDALRRTITDPGKLREMSGSNQAITPVPTEFVSRTGPLVER